MEEGGAKSRDCTIACMPRQFSKEKNARTMGKTRKSFVGGMVSYTEMQPRII